MLKAGTIKNCIRLNRKQITFMFDIPEPIKKEQGEIVGVDIGFLNTISCSNGVQTQIDNHGHTLNSIIKTLSRKKRGSKGFKRTELHRTNYIN
jgi:transposase